MYVSTYYMIPGMLQQYLCTPDTYVQQLHIAPALLTLVSCLPRDIPSLLLLYLRSPSTTAVRLHLLLLLLCLLHVPLRMYTLSTRTIYGCAVACS